MTNYLELSGKNGTEACKGHLYRSHCPVGIILQILETVRPYRDHIVINREVIKCMCLVQCFY